MTCPKNRLRKPTYTSWVSLAVVAACISRVTDRYRHKGPMASSTHTRPRLHPLCVPEYTSLCPRSFIVGECSGGVASPEYATSLYAGFASHRTYTVKFLSLPHTRSPSTIVRSSWRPWSKT